MTYIGYKAFSYCKSLDTVDLSKNVKSLDLYTFYETPWIEKQVDNHGLTIINNVLLSRSIENLSADEIEELAILSGDVTNDGLVNALDLSEMIKILILNEQSDYKTLKNSDINKDEAVNILDLILLKQKLLCKE